MQAEKITQIDQQSPSLENNLDEHCVLSYYVGSVVLFCFWRKEKTLKAATFSSSLSSHCPQISFCSSGKNSSCVPYSWVFNRVQPFCLYQRCSSNSTQRAPYHQHSGGGPRSEILPNTQTFQQFSALNIEENYWLF